MTLEQLKEIVRQHIAKARIEKAIEVIRKWAHQENKDQLKSDIAKFKGELATLNRNKLLGLLSHSEANLQNNKLVNSVLNLLNSLGEDSIVGTTTSILHVDASKQDLYPRKILMLTANPANTTKLNLDKEHSNIVQKLQEKQDLFTILLKKAVSGTEFKEFTQTEKPDILHFSGHGEGGKYTGIVVQNDDKNEEELIPSAGLKMLFKFFKKKMTLKVVILNACHTEEQAQIISEYVEYVIGTNVAIGDKAASAFSSGFYFQLAENQDFNIEDAFDSGRTEAVMKGAQEDNFVLYKNGVLIQI